MYPYNYHWSFNLVWFVIPSLGWITTTRNAIMSDLPTPRTGVRRFEVVVGREPDGSSRVEWVVPLEDANQLERELFESQAREAQLRKALTRIKNDRREPDKVLCHIQSATLSPPPPVIPLTEHERVVKELNDRLTDFGQSHLAASARDLDERRKLEKEIALLRKEINQTE